MTKVLVTDAHHRKALSAVRSLGKEGIEVIAGAADKMSMTRFSKYCTSLFTYPDPYVEPDKFITFMLDYIQDDDFDVLLPMDDITVELFAKHLDEFVSYVNLPIPDYDTFLKGRDKGKTIKKAIDTGVPAPDTYFIDDLDQIKDLKEKIEYPVVIKPRISSGSRGITYVKKKDDLITSYQQVHKDFPYPLLQEFIPQTGRKFQVLLLIDETGNIKGSCIQELLRQFPVNGGPGTLYKTISYPELKEISADFLREIDWYGIACVEYITDPRTGNPKFMEINPRFWGTLNLSLQVGVNFPYLLAQLALDKEIDSVHNSAEDEYCQWLLPGDFLNFIFNPQRFSQEINYFFNQPDDFYYAILSSSDPWPSFGAVISLLRDSFKLEKLKDVFGRGK